jgi:predicted dehydrogenase
LAGEPTSGTFGWGILGTGRIARAFAEALAQSQTGRLVAVGSRDQERAERLVSEHAGSSALSGTYDDVVGDPRVDVVYIALPNHLHAEWVARAARSGKHVLCEKPFALNAIQAAAALDECEANDVFCMEAFMYRCHRQTALVRRLLVDGAVGEVRLIEAVFGGNAVGRRQGDIRDVNAYGGGAILDLGSYCTSMARLLANAPCAELRAVGALGPSGVDVRSTAVVRFENDVLAVLTCARDTEVGSWVAVHGTRGALRVHEPWIPTAEARIEIVDSLGRRTIDSGVEDSVYALEADVVAHSLSERQADVMTWAATVENARMLDDWRDDIGAV